MKIGIFVGSQTGTAQEFAETLESEGSDAGFECTVIDLEEFEPEMFMEYGRLIFCVATYGEGDPCDNANDFDAWVKEEKRDEYFEDVKYTVFGLGNRQYEHYNAQGRFVDKTLESFGAKRMYPYGEGDDDGTLEEDFESWKAKLWTTLRRNELGLESEDTSSKLPKPATLPFVAKTSTIQKQQNGNSRHRRPSADARIGLVSKPYFEIIPLKVVKNVELRQTLELGSTRHVELDIKGTNLASYRTADNLGIIPCNRESSVKSLATHLGYDLDRVFELVPNPDCKKDGKLIFPTPCSVREALSMYCDLHASPSRPFLRTLAA
jgi:NADPH-ferrihemoprotein reductase